MSSIDEIGWQLLRDLQQNARLPFAELGRRVGLSLPAVAERVRRMEETGIIQGYRAELSTEQIGFSMLVFIQLKTDATHYPLLVQRLETMPEVLECHHVTGVDSFIMKAAFKSKEHLEEFVQHLGSFGQTTTSLVLSTPISKRVFSPPKHLANKKNSSKNELHPSDVG